MDKFTGTEVSKKIAVNNTHLIVIRRKTYPQPRAAMNNSNNGDIETDDDDDVVMMV